MSVSRIHSYKKQVEKRMFLRYVLETTFPAVVALVNEKDKKILIHAARNPYQFLGNIAQSLVNRTHPNKQLIKDQKKLYFKILSPYSISRYGIVDKLEWIAHYRSTGWTLYNTEKLATYRVAKAVTQDMKVQVRLVSAGRRIYPVREFESVQEADSFISTTTVYDMMRIIIGG